MDQLRFAINMELDGEKYYLEQAEINKDNSLSTIFKFLAKDERKHAAILENKLNNLPYELEEDEALAAFENVFEGKPEFKLETKTHPKQIDVYRLALKKEKESIDLYQKLQEEADDKEGKELFEYLVEMEKQHYRILDEIVQHLLKAEQWVEDAEFGLREIY